MEATGGKETLASPPYEFVALPYGREYLSQHPEFHEVIEKYSTTTTHDTLRILEEHRKLTTNTQALETIPPRMQVAIEANRKIAEGFEREFGVLIGGLADARESIKIRPNTNQDVLFCEVLEEQLPFKDVPALLADYEKLAEFLTNATLPINFRVPKFLGYIKIPATQSEKERVIILREYIDGTRLDDPSLDITTQQTYRIACARVLKSFLSKTYVQREIDYNPANYLYISDVGQIVGIDVFK